MERDHYWDSLKVVLIFLVVYAHTISPFKVESTINTATYNFIYLFHMPLFIFISGRFSHIHNKIRYIHRIWRLIETYIIFQIILTTISLIHGGHLSLACFITPKWILWYLPALVYWRLIIYFTPERWFLHRKSIIILSLFLSLAIGYIQIGYTFAIHRAICFLPFFLGGYYSTEIHILNYIKKIPFCTAIGLLLLIFLFNSFGLNENISYICHCPYSDWNHNFEILSYPFIRFLYILFVITLCAVIMRIISTSVIAKWGNTTMFTYIYHSLILSLVLFPLISRGHLPKGELFLFSYALLIVYSCILLSHQRVFIILLNPVSYYLNKKQKQT